MHDFEPITGRIHQPPPSHQTFQGQNFVICSFCPRKLDFDPLAVPIPYHHSSAAASLREHYARGYLTLDEFSSRTGRVLSARSRGQLRRGLVGLSRAPFAESVHASVRDLVLVVTGAYVVFSLVLAPVLGLTVLLHGVSALAFLAIAVVWLVPTYLFARL